MSDNSKEINQLSPLQRSFLVIERLQAKLDALQQAKIEPIAIIGMACRFPGGANSPDDFWQLLHNGVDTITEVPPERWDIDAYYDADPDSPGKMYSRYGAFLDQVDQFDPDFFNISPREANSMDPQQRLLLEVSWEALENAGQAASQLRGSQSGVFIGITNHDYSNVLRDAGGITQIDAYSGIGTALNGAAGRLSYTLGLQGPSLAIDTACSSSLVALHLACQSLRRKECDLALTGGISLTLSPENFITKSRAHMLSPDGRCKTFDEAANGFVAGEGCGVLILKPLSKALHHGDTILALIQGSAVNQDGASGGFTVPNKSAQETLIRQALSSANINASQVNYVEAHGTGTSLGDPIELRALATALTQDRSPENPLIVSSVKTNIGHLEAAAGVAGLIKVILSLQHQEIPPHLHLKTPTPHVDWDALAIHIPTKPMPWPMSERPLAGISSFGASGTNAHVILEAPPAPETPSKKTTPLLHLLPLSAKDNLALKQLAQRYQTYLSTALPKHPLADICYTAQSGRSHFKHRLSVVGANADEMAQKLAAFTSGEQAVCLAEGTIKGSHSPKIAYLFTGQGSQYTGMGRVLYQTQATFRQTLNHCAEILDSHLDTPLLEVLYPDNKDGVNHTSNTPPEQALIHQTAYAQPALFALEYALAKVWESWGITAGVLMGHSVGEYVAACLAGVFSLEDGLRLIAARGRLMQALPQQGLMLAVATSEGAIIPLLKPYTQQVSIAAINGPESVVISGESEIVETLKRTLIGQEIKTHQLSVSHAFHSPLMRPMLAEFKQIAESIAYSHPKRPLVSNIRGKLASSEVATADYWVAHVSQPVRFAMGVETLQQQKYKHFLEIGPQATLLGMGQSCLPDDAYVWLPSLRKKQNDWQPLLQSLGTLYTQGFDINWPAFKGDYQNRSVMLPNYPFQRQRYWAKPHLGAKQKETALAQTHSQTDLVNLLNAGDIPALTKQLEKGGLLSKEAIKHLPTFLDILVKEQQKQMDMTAISEWLYEIKWQPKPHQAAEKLDSQPSKTEGKWLIFADSKGVGQALATEMQKQGVHCFQIYAGESYQQIDANEWQLNPAQPTAFEPLFEAIHAADPVPLQGVIHLWNLDTPASDVLTSEDFEQMQRLGCSSVLYLLQILVKYSNSISSTYPRLWVLTQNAMPVGEANLTLAVAQASVWGLGKVIALEHPEVWGGLLDLPLQVNDADIKKLLSEIWQADAEDHIAWRDGRRYVARLRRSQKPEHKEISFQDEGSTLITGGLGGLGLQIAHHLIKQGKPHLILVGRSGLANPAAQKAVEDLKEAGGQIMVASADIANQAEVASLLADIKKTMPPLRGIIHAAGILDDASLLEQSHSRFMQVMAPKVAGAWNLHTLTQDMTLDFFVLFSSAAALLGAFGQGNYAAGNAFLDALAHYRRGLGQASLSINWGAWAEVGMAARLNKTQQEQIALQGIDFLSPAQGLQAFDYLLKETHPQIGVIPINWSLFKQQLGNTYRSSLLLEWQTKELLSEETLQTGPAQAQVLQDLEMAPISERKKRLMVYTQKELANVLGQESNQLPSPKKGFADMGLDSLMAVTLRKRLSKALDATLPATLAFDYPTLNKLVDYLAQEVMGWQSTQDNKPHLENEATQIEDMSEEAVETSIAESLANLESLLG